MQNLIHFFQAGGWVMWPLAGLTVLAIAVILERLFAYRMLANISYALIEDVIEMAEKKEYEAAHSRCLKGKGPLAASLATVLEHRYVNVNDVERYVQEVAEPYFIAMEDRLPILDTTTTIAPLLGLLGTLFGMIGTFHAIAASKNQSANDSILSGVGEALYATATGLSLAVVCFITYNYFAARSRGAVMQTEQASTRLINVLRAQGLLTGNIDNQEIHGVQAAARA